MEVPPIYKALGRAVGRLRRQKRLTQQQLADAIGISRASVANIERGEQRVFFDQVATIADFFSLASVDSLLSYAESEVTPTKRKMSLSGDRLSRDLKREVRGVIDELLLAQQ